MCCELDRAFEEVSTCDAYCDPHLTVYAQFHNDDKSPYGPITMLYAMWHASAELEGYGQQGELFWILFSADPKLTRCRCAFLLPRSVGSDPRARQRPIV